MEVPNLPGFRRNPFAARPLAQSLDVNSFMPGLSGAVVRPTVSRAPEDVPPSPGATKGDASYSSLRRGGPYHATFKQRQARETGGVPLPFRESSALPTFLKFDPHGQGGSTLLFNVYFKEAVTESPLEDHRVRKLRLKFYAEDGTMELIEPPLENAGMPQGPFLARARVPRPDGSGDYTASDLRVQDEITVYGRVLRIYDCDGATRRYYERIGLDQAPAEAVPADTHEQLRHLRKTLETGFGEGVNRGKKLTTMKTHQEAALGAQQHSVRTRGKFLEGDGKVLCFNCVLDDRDRLGGAKRMCALHFFLANDTFEMVEAYERNDGRDRFPLLMSRRKVPRNFEELLFDDRERSVEAPPRAGEYLGMDDLGVGKRVNIYGRELLIVDCDEFTRTFLSGERGVEEPPAVDHKTPPPSPRAVPVPPHIFPVGTEEDSMGSVKYVVPRRPREDITLLLRYDGKILRFLAVLKSSNPDDALRKFIISFYLGDNTVQVYEEQIPNIGVIGGKGLERARRKNPATGEFFTPRDFTPGTIVNVGGRDFHIVDMDKFTEQFLTEGAVRGAGGLLDRQKLIRCVKQRIIQRHGDDRLHQTFNEVDQAHLGVVHEADMRSIMLKLDRDADSIDLAAVMAYFDRNGDGVITYEEFRTVMLEQGVAEKEAIERAVGAAEHYAQHVSLRSLEGGAETPIRAALRRLFERYGLRRNELLTLLRKNDDKHIGHVTAKGLRTSLLEAGISEADTRVLVDHYFPAPDVLTLDFELAIANIWRAFRARV